MGVDWNRAADQATTLMHAHQALSRLMPRPDADPRMWLRYYERSAAVYARVAEVDRGHFHEATFWATREREKVDEIRRALTAVPR